MPTNSRCRVIREFNQGKWPFLIASECNDIFDESQEIKEELKGKKDQANINIFIKLNIVTIFHRNLGHLIY